jgi:hypothetical protein
MGRMKDLVIDMEDTFYDHCYDIVSGCEVVEDFVSEISEYQFLMPLHSDSDFTELVVDIWNDYWQEKGHE